MIRINLLPVKRKKKAKPLSAFVITSTFVILILLIALAYLFFYYDANLQSAKKTVETNKQKIVDLKEKIKEVEDFEKLNKTYDERTKVIEQLRRNQNIPAMMLDEISRDLPAGIWLQSLTISGGNVNIDGFGFTNADVVAYVDNLKKSNKFSDIYLQESKQTEIEKIPLYSFKLTFKVLS
ncbi:MAG TPA: PilN domain-containing protein [Thermodesulfovibrionales bacterium]|nr:PilN domain-containing protein [Thermodesulfovibrionales bacterium]